ncbi:MAG: hypothetical protein NT027_12695 [Proteobacteria bacterium]|nr:hypothetical protein [Pseudomonadota bacterium]
MIKKIAAFSVALGLYTTAFADEIPPASTTETTSPKDAKHSGRVTPSCDPIEAACKSAGFVAGDWKVKNGLWANCVSPIIRGKPVAKVAVDPSWNLTGCKTELDAAKAKKEAKKMAK